MNSNHLPGRKIVWAVDPFCKSGEILRSAAWALRGLAAGSSTAVYPIYIWRNLPVEVAADLDFLAELRKRGESKLGPILRVIEVPGIRPLQIVSKTENTIRDVAQALVSYAKEVGADQILVSSRGQRGVKRILVGSFCEALTLYSDIPLVIVHPNQTLVPDFKQILFATDFSAESKEAFETLLEFAKTRKSRISIFHKTETHEYIGWTSFDSAFGVTEAYGKWLESERASRWREANALRELAKGRRIRADVVIDSSPTGNVADAILKAAEKRNSVVALASQSGPVSSVLLGSTARRVARLSQNPVWIIHPVLRASTQGEQPGLKVGSLAEVDEAQVEYGSATRTRMSLRLRIS